MVVRPPTTTAMAGGAPNRSYNAAKAASGPLGPLRRSRSFILGVQPGRRPILAFAIARERMQANWGNSPLVGKNNNILIITA